MTIRLSKLAPTCILWILAGAPACAQLPDAPGKDVTVKVCGNCHDIDVIAGYHQGKQAWSDMIAQMIEKGAEGTEDEFKTVLDYLVKNFGPNTQAKVNINKAPASELASQLELTAKEAAAIVQYRSEKGSFKEISDLKKVPDLDFQKIEAKKDRLVF
jgi:competence ComEA-like helix-hairpin-helix protein